MKWDLLNLSYNQQHTSQFKIIIKELSRITKLSSTHYLRSIEKQNPQIQTLKRPHSTKQTTPIWAQRSQHPNQPLPTTKNPNFDIKNKTSQKNTLHLSQHHHPTITNLPINNVRSNTKENDAIVGTINVRQTLHYPLAKIKESITMKRKKKVWKLRNTMDTHLREEKMWSTWNGEGCDCEEEDGTVRVSKRKRDWSGEEKSDQREQFAHEKRECAKATCDCDQWNETHCVKLSFGSGLFQYGSWGSLLWKLPAQQLRFDLWTTLTVTFFCTTRIYFFRWFICRI